MTAHAGPRLGTGYLENPAAAMALRAPCNGIQIQENKQVLAINMFITYSTPLPIRNDTPGTHKTLKVVWEPANFNAIISEELGKGSSNKGRMIVTGM